LNVLRFYGCKVSTSGTFIFLHFFGFFFTPHWPIENISRPMLNRRLLETLSRLSTAERHRLQLFLRSPYFNRTQQAEQLLALYDYIVTFGADEERPEMSKAVVFSHFFPEKIFQENEKGPLDALMSNLFALVRQFLAQEMASKKAGDSNFEESLAWLRFCRRHGLKDWFEQAIEATQKKQIQQPYRDADFYHRQYLLEEELAAFQSLHNSFEDDANIRATTHHLDTYYSLLKLDMACALRYQYQTAPADPFDNDPMLDSVLASVAQGGLVGTPLLDIHARVFHLLKHPDDDAEFAVFEQLLENEKAQIPPDIYSNFQAYHRFFWGIRYAKSGNATFRQKLFDIYRAHFEQGYFYIDDAISVNSLQMLTKFALLLGESEWIKKVLDEHPPARICGTRYPSEAHNFCLAEYYFYRKEYAQALERLTYRMFENPARSILTDVLLIKIYFETNDDLLDSRMKALEQKVRRSRISANPKARCLNFLKKLDKVVRYGWEKKHSRRAKLIAEIESTPQIIEREWLLEKMGK
jgi:hypothetical protein